MNPYVMGEMTWPEVKQALATVRLVIVPIGSHEQHGPHLAMSCDTARAFELARLVARYTHPFTMVSPPINMGMSHHHMDFPGTISLAPATLVSLLIDMANSLKRHGIRKLFLLNAHGGNQAVLETAVHEIHERTSVLAATCNYTALVKDVVERLCKSDIIGHSCEREVSEALFLAPSLVRHEALEKGKVKGFAHPFLAFASKTKITMPYSFRDITENGALGDATLATREAGQEICEASAGRIADFVRFMVEDDLR